MHSAVAKVRHLLGDDSAAAKLFVKFWLAWGHPRAFCTEVEAKLWKELSCLSAVLVVDSSMPLEAAQNKVKVIMTYDGKVIQRRLMFVAQKLLCGDLDVESGKCLMSLFACQMWILNANAVHSCCREFLVVNSLFSSLFFFFL